MIRSFLSWWSETRRLHRECRESATPTGYDYDRLIRVLWVIATVEIIRLLAGSLWYWLWRPWTGEGQ